MISFFSLTSIFLIKLNILSMSLFYGSMIVVAFELIVAFHSIIGEISRLCCFSFQELLTFQKLQSSVQVVIYSPARTATQQGSGKVGKWEINFLSTQKYAIFPYFPFLMDILLIPCVDNGL